MTTQFSPGAASIVLACSLLVADTSTGQPAGDATVCVNLMENDQVSGAASSTLRSEATRIWLQHRIRLLWTPAVTSACQAAATIVIDEAHLRRVSGGTRDEALARTVFQGRTQVIYVSAARAFEMLVHLRKAPMDMSSTDTRDIRGGTLLGRVVAHELGHLLLATLSHSSAGLMRPVFRTADILSTDDGNTDLSANEQQRLAMRFSLVPNPTILATREP